jgi:tripartite-type tricarboxylate transporter receptor subunit TctC
LVGALVAGEIDVVFVNARTPGLAIRAWKAKALAVTAPGRLPGFPDFPTMEESGFPGIGTTHWHGLFASSRTPGEMVSVLHLAVTRALGSEEVRRAFADAGCQAAPSTSPPEFADQIRREMARWQKVIADINLLAGDNRRRGP